MSTIGCYKGDCYATITLDPKTERDLRRSHATFYCTAGHAQHFAGKTDEEKRIEQLERDLAHEGRAHLQTSRDRERIREQRDKVIACLRQCPLCLATPGRAIAIGRDGQRRWSFDDNIAELREWLAGHLLEAHGADVLTPAMREAAEV